MDKQDQAAAVEALIVAVPETAGSALYGMLDVLAATGNLWQQLVGMEAPRALVRPRIVSLSREPFRCGNGIPVEPHVGLDHEPEADIVILPELWLAPDDDMRGRYPDLLDWIRRRYRAGSTIYSACSGSVMLAATGLLGGREATSHWGYQDLFRTRYPDVHFRPEPNLAFADPAGRIVTAGGTTSWHDLAIHIIARHCSPGEAMRIAKVYLLKWHAEGQLPYASLSAASPTPKPRARCRGVAAKHFRSRKRVGGGRLGDPRAQPEASLQAGDGADADGHVQNLRIEEASASSRRVHLLRGGRPELGYENPAFFRRIFKRRTGLTRESTAPVPALRHLLGGSVQPPRSRRRHEASHRRSPFVPGWRSAAPPRAWGLSKANGTST